MTANGSTVATFEREFAQYVGAKYAIACSNGTVTLQAALVALGVKPGDRVAVPPLTMSATTIAALNVGAVPVFVDVDERTWLMDVQMEERIAMKHALFLGVSLYGLGLEWCGHRDIDDAAQTLRKHSGAAFTSYSFQASKILSTGEGGMLVTNDEALAAAARSYLSLGYKLRPDQPRINPETLKAPTFQRHFMTLAINGRMNDVTAELGLRQLDMADAILEERAEAAGYYAQASRGCEWLTPQFVPEGWTHDYWTYAVACDTPQRAMRLAAAVVAAKGERPYAAWRLTYHEPAFRHLALSAGVCPTAESLQPRLLQFQTNDLDAAARNADALRTAIIQCDDV